MAVNGDNSVERLASENLPSADAQRPGREVINPFPQPTRDINDLFHPPKDLALVRQRLFEVRDKIELRVDEFERYWPYIDNVWVRQHRAGTDKTGKIELHNLCDALCSKMPCLNSARRSQGAMLRDGLCCLFANDVHR